MGAVVKQRNLAAMRKHCPPKNYQSLFATRCRFGSAGASPSQFFPSLVPRPLSR
ncbi:MAG: hypothetical protein ACO2PL_03390 [Armatimonadota bacterium]